MLSHGIKDPLSSRSQKKKRPKGKENWGNAFQIKLILSNSSLGTSYLCLISRIWAMYPETVPSLASTPENGRKKKRGSHMLFHSGHDRSIQSVHHPCWYYAMCTSFPTSTSWPSCRVLPLRRPWVVTEQKKTGLEALTLKFMVSWISSDSGPGVHRIALKAHYRRIKQLIQLHFMWSFWVNLRILNR